MELEVYSRLTEFFNRYYKEGDFISQRRYKEGVYAIPYEGEEVKLHWANHDQYYIKTGEHFKNYTFKVDGKTIHFVLKEASTERDNNKTKTGKERRFKLLDETIAEGPLFEETEAGELNIYFTYEPLPRSERQDKLNSDAVKQLTQELPGMWTQLLLQTKPTANNKKRTLLEYRLNDYTAKNTFDYFIHKDLGTFLRRELDFYIKNEILHIDDIDLDNEQHFQKQLTLIKAFKKVAHKIIDFLAQLEDFQKKLWLKKKMVLQSDYCITLDRIDEAFYEEIAQNKAQIEEWKHLFVIEELDDYSEPLSVEFLQNNPFLLVDTKFFPREFKYKLLATFENIDEQCDGLLINSENFQALNLLQERYNSQIKSIYIDPPYNSDASKIAYKNDYEHSSWLSLMHDRVMLSNNILSQDGILQVAIDDIEFSRLENMLKQTYGSPNYIGNIAIMNNPKGRDAKFFAASHEYTLLVAKDIRYSTTNRLLLNQDKLKKKYPKITDGKRCRELPLRRSGSEAQRRDRPYMYFPFIYKNGFLQTIPEDEYKKIYKNNKFNDVFVEKIQQQYESKGYKFILPIRENGSRGRWRWGYDTCKKGCLDNLLFHKGNTIYQIDYADETYLPKSLWYGESHDSSSKGTNLLKNIISNNPFDYPKSLPTVIDFINITSNKNSIILDYFSGSATTAHAAISLNRADNGKRKYILVEMGEYFNSVTKPRVAKVIYSDEWRNGKPTTRKGSSHMFKYSRLESYEDTLNNLVLQKTDMDAAMHEGYILRYSLEVESRDSLLMLEAFQSPFGYTIQSTENNELKETEVDLVDTFNYLIGLQVKTMEVIRDYVVVTGKTLDEKKVLVIWRDLEKHSNEDLNEFFSRLRYNPLDGEFAQIYVNGDNNIENLKIGDERWKVTLIEHEFHKRMWDIAAE